MPGAQTSEFTRGKTAKSLRCIPAGRAGAAAACARLQLLLCAVLAGNAFAQPENISATFDIASIRSYEGPSSSGSFSVSGNRLTIRGFTVGGLILRAYNVKDYQIEQFWSLDRTRYDIVATLSDTAPTAADFCAALQKLLEDRFNLKVRRELRAMPVYALVVDKQEPKFKASASDAPDTVKLETQGRSIAATKDMGMQELAEDIRNNAGLDRPVIDKTGLVGRYRIRLVYTPERRKSHGVDPGADEIDVFVAVRQQLGLRLEHEVGSVAMLIVDHVERPSEN
jgi:uncharacterized protein (TIGR03435 family)